MSYISRRPRIRTPGSLNCVPLVEAILIMLFTGSRLVTAQIPVSGNRCPEKVSSTAIDLKQIVGQWYEIEASPTFMEYPFKCIAIQLPTFYEKSSQIRINAVNRMTPESSMIQEISAVIPASSNEQDGKLELVVKPPEGEFEPETMSRLRKKYEHYPIQVLATDYSNWGLVWMCKEQESANARTELLWVLSRKHTLTEDQYMAVQEAKRKHRVDSIKTRDTIQFGCSRDEVAEDEDDDYE